MFIKKRKEILYMEFNEDYKELIKKMFDDDLDEDLLTENEIEKITKIQELAEKNGKTFQKRLEKASEEKYNLAKPYLPIEYYKDGYFNSDEFKHIEDDLYDELYIKTIESGIKDLKDILINIDKLKTEILKERYNINWKPLEAYYPKNFEQKCKKIEEKYKVNITLYF